MKRAFTLITLLSVISWFSSCKKESGNLLSETFVRQFNSDTDFASQGIIPLDDGSYVLAGFEYRTEYPVRRNPPRLIKMDVNANVIWDKRIPQSGTTLYKLLPVAGKGFLTLGVADFNSNEMVLCLYNYDGEVISTHQIDLKEHNYDMSPFDIIHLSNGNYAIAGNNQWTGFGILKILNSGYSPLYHRQFVPPDPDHYNVVFRRLCETPDGSIALAASTLTYTPVYELKSAIVRTDLTGELKSFQILADSGHNETPYAIAFHNNSLVVPAVEYSMDWQKGYGCEVNYDLHYSVSGLGSGRISIKRFSNSGVLVERKDVSGYPRNGMIHSMHPTSDGGFICCGTVDQADSYYMLSDTKMYLLKLDANLNSQWSKTIYTAYQSFGVEAIQTPDNGYMVCGFQRSMDTRFQIMLIKIDANGNY